MFWVAHDILDPLLHSRDTKRDMVNFDTAWCGDEIWISEKRERIINSVEKRKKNQQVEKAFWRKGAPELPFENLAEDHEKDETWGDSGRGPFQAEGSVLGTVQRQQGAS